MAYRERKRWLFFALPFTFTIYTIDEEILSVKMGLIKQVENDCYMYKVQDVTLETSLMERIFKIGTVICETGDVTDPKLVLRHIKHAREIKDYILKESETQRLRRRTVNMLDIGASDDFSDGDLLN